MTLNPKWESLEVLTKCAISGGVTSILVQTSLYQDAQVEVGNLYCDVGRVKLVDEAQDCTLSADWPELAWKTYLFPPSFRVSGSKARLHDILKESGKQGVPLYIDPSLPSARMLYPASPYRVTTLEERLVAKSLPDEGLVAAALPDEINPSSSNSSSDDDFEESPKFTFSNLESVVGGLQVPKPKHELSTALPTLPVMETKEPEPRRSSRTLTDGVLSKVKESQGDITMLSVMEQSAYSKAGPTLYNTCNSASTSTSEWSFPAPDADELHLGDNSMFQDRMRRFRPSLLSVNKQKVGITQEAEVSKEATYQIHLANCPEHWEKNGVQAVLSAIKDIRYRGKVHFTNLSSAAAISELLEHGKLADLSCSTSPHYLYFCMEDVTSGNTRLKTFPAIRNKTNTNLLWDLLKLEAIDQITSHHSAIPRPLKVPESGSFKRALSGINGLGASLQAVWSKLRRPYAHSFEHYIVRLFKWMSLNPAKFLGLSDLKGTLAPGKDADIIVWDPYESFTFRSFSDFPDLSPYDGNTLYGKVHKVFLRGQLAFDSGKFFPVGERLWK